MFYRRHREDIYDLSWSPDSTQLISGSVDNTAIVWDVASGCALQVLGAHRHFVQGVAWHPGNKFVATQSSDRTVMVYSLAAGSANGESKAGLHADKCVANVARRLLKDAYRTEKVSG